jgi:hypothetical protein
LLTVPMIGAAFAHQRKKAARNTIFRWIREQTEAGILRPVTRGLYLNQLARPQPTAAEAASFVRSGAIVSLQTVLGDAGITNSYSDIVTSVLPAHGVSLSRAAPSSQMGSNIAFMQCPHGCSMKRRAPWKIGWTWMSSIHARRRRKRFWIGSTSALPLARNSRPLHSTSTSSASTSAGSSGSPQE